MKTVSFLIDIVEGLTVPLYVSMKGKVTTMHLSRDWISIGAFGMVSL